MTVIDSNSDGRLFPDKVHFFTFLLYISLFINQGLLVTWTKNADGSYSYNTTTVVLLTECLKLLLAVTLYLMEKRCLKEFCHEFCGNLRVLALYLIPAFLYCLYNNLAFVNLQHFDPTSYFLLLNFRTVATGIIFQFLFKNRLTSRQWMALIILTLGCIVKQIELDEVGKIGIRVDLHLGLMLIQVFCSCFAGVYNEYLLKDSKSSGIHIMIQNCCMYLDSILMNLGFMFFNGTILSAFTLESLKTVFRPSVLAIVGNNGIAGITTSIFLKKFNSILKSFAGAIELLMTAILSWIFFGIAINSTMVLSIGFVSYAMYLYAMQPVVNPPQTPAAPAGSRDAPKEVILGVKGEEMV